MDNTLEINIFGKDISENEVRMLNPLILAYVGDCIFDLYIRTNILIENKNSSINKLHKKAVQFVKASKQKEIILKIMEKLTEEEICIFKRGRNSKSNTSPKNVEIGSYRIATGFEALLGYLYLTKQYVRLKELIEFSLEGEVL